MTSSRGPTTSTCPVSGPNRAPPTSVTRRASVGKPMPLDAWVSDDGLPPPAPASATRNRQTGAAGIDRRLTLTWSQYRGAGRATFEQTAPTIDLGKASTTVTFSEPGDYMLRALASDGSAFSEQCCWTNGYVKVQVTR